MDHATIVAVAVAALAAGAALLVPLRLRPDRATRLIAALAMVSFASVAWTLLLVVSSNVVQLHGIAEHLGWCSDLVYRHRGSFTPAGLFALVAMTAAGWSTTRVRIRQRRQRAPKDGRSLAVIASADPVAYALPGRPGQVVVSTGMLRSLDGNERRVLLAHERSHLRRRHHRYVRVTELASAALPLLAPLNARIRFAIERWADEDAAAEVGDRALVASAIARAALASQRGPGVGLALADRGVVQRVEIMLAGSPADGGLIAILLTAVTVAAVGGLVTSLILIEPRVLAVLGLCH